MHCPGTISVAVSGCFGNCMHWCIWHSSFVMAKIIAFLLCLNVRLSFCGPVVTSALLEFCLCNEMLKGACFDRLCRHQNNMQDNGGTEVALHVCGRHVNLAWCSSRWTTQSMQCVCLDKTSPHMVQSHQSTGGSADVCWTSCWCLCVVVPTLQQRLYCKSLLACHCTDTCLELQSCRRSRQPIMHRLRLTLPLFSYALCDVIHILLICFLSLHAEGSNACCTACLSRYDHDVDVCCFHTSGPRRFEVLASLLCALFMRSTLVLGSHTSMHTCIDHWEMLWLMMLLIFSDFGIASRHGGCTCRSWLS